MLFWTYDNIDKITTNKSSTKKLSPKNKRTEKSEKIIKQDKNCSGENKMNFNLVNNLDK